MPSPRAARHLRARSRHLLVTLVGVALLALGCNQQPAANDQLQVGFFPPQAATQQAQDINVLYPIVFWIAVAIFLLVEGLLLFIVFRYRRRSGDTELPAQVHGSNKMELVWTIIPALIVTAIFVMTIGTLSRVEAKSQDYAVAVDVTGFQWQWTMEYRDQGITMTGQGTTGPEMVVPVGETVRVRLHSNDVIHAFYVPHFLYKKDVVPGRTNEFDFRMEAPATYTGQCAEFCGLAHAAMYFTVRGVPRAEYDQWLAQKQAEANATPEPAASGATALEVTASSVLSFDQSALEAPANTPIAITFINNDPSAPHDVSIRSATPEGDFNGQPDANPGETVTYNAPALDAGEYIFYCSIHPNMQGNLAVR